MASVSPFRPSTPAIRMSWQPRVFRSLNTLSQNLPLGLLDPEAPHVALAVGLNTQGQIDGLVADHFDSSLP